MNIIAKLVLVLLLTSSQSGCLIVQGVERIPRATLALQGNTPKHQTASGVPFALHDLLVSNEFIDKPKEKHSSVYYSRDKKHKRVHPSIYYKDRFKVNVYTGGYSDKEHLHVEFYERNSCKFSKNGTELFYRLESQLRDANMLVPNAMVTSPEAYNEQYAANCSVSYLKLFKIALGLMVYFIALYFLISIFRDRAGVLYRSPINTVRLVQIGLVSLILFPVAIPLSMFGPLLLVPAPIGISIYWSNDIAYSVVLILASIGMTFVFLVTIEWIKSRGVNLA